MVTYDYFNDSGNRLEQHVERLSNSHHIQMIISVDRLASLSEFAVKNAIMKAAIYSGTVIVVFPSLVRSVRDGDPPHRTVVEDVISPSPVIKRLVEDLQFEPSVQFVPASLELHEEGFDGTGYGSWNTTLFSFKEKYRNPWGMKVNLDSKTIRSNFGEINNYGVNLWLPQISNLSLDTFFKLKDDESDSFRIVQNELKAFLRSLNQADDEARVIELGLYLDDQLRKYEARMKALKAKYPIALGQLAIGMTAIGLISVLPDYVEKLISGFLGSAQVQGGITRLFNNKESLVDIRQSPFYVTWLLSEMNRKL